MDQIEKKLYRSKTDRVIFGVCGGLAEYFQVDVVIFRVLFLLLSLFHGFGIVAYLILAVILRVEPEDNIVAKPLTDTGEFLNERVNEIAQEIKVASGERIGRGRKAIGFLAVAAGVYLLLQDFFPRYLSWLDWQIVLSLAAIAVGFYLLTKK